MILVVDLYFTQLQKLRSPKKNPGFNRIQTCASPKQVGCFNQLSFSSFPQRNIIIFLMK